VSDERGNAALELTLVTPILLALLLFVAAGGRLVNSQNQVEGAARDAARAASLRDDPATAAQDAHTAAVSTLAAHHVTCRSPTVDVDTSDLHPGGAVRVVVHCTVALADLALLRLPGERTITARATEVIDQYRASP
jgi:Flp pilus assembly protein TadG